MAAPHATEYVTSSLAPLAVPADAPVIFSARSELGGGSLAAGGGGGRDGRERLLDVATDSDDYLMEQKRAKPAPAHAAA